MKKVSYVIVLILICFAGLFIAKMLTRESVPEFPVSRETFVSPD